MAGILVAPVLGSTAGANKWHLGLLNATGTKLVLEIVGVQVVPSDAAAVAGTGTGFTLQRLSALGTGTAVVVRRLDKLLPAVPTSVTALSNLLSPTAESNPELASLAVNTEETAVTSSGPALWPPHGLEAEPVVLNPGDGVGVQQGALASAGAVDVYIYFRIRRR